MTNQETDEIRERLGELSDWHATTHPEQPGECYQMARVLLDEVERLRKGLLALELCGPCRDHVRLSAVVALLEGE